VFVIFVVGLRAWHGQVEVWMTGVKRLLIVSGIWLTIITVIFHGFLLGFLLYGVFPIMFVWAAWWVWDGFREDHQ
jgi:hypothetical protein